MNPQLFEQIERLPSGLTSTLELVESTLAKVNESTGFGRPSLQDKILVAAIFNSQFRSLIFNTDEYIQIRLLLESGHANYHRLKQTSPVQQNLKAVFEEVVNQEDIF